MKPQRQKYTKHWTYLGKIQKNENIISLLIKQSTNAQHKINNKNPQEPVMESFGQSLQTV